MPHNLETLCLCYADQTRSEVPISSSNRDTIRKGGETAFSFPRSSLPRCRVVITQREVLIRLGIHPDANAVKPVRKALGYTIQTLEAFGARPLFAVASAGWMQREKSRTSQRLRRIEHGNDGTAQSHMQSDSI